jgi:phosphate starvation-inducible PhoH-like protein
LRFNDKLDKYESKEIEQNVIISELKYSNEELQSNYRKELDNFNNFKSESDAKIQSLTKNLTQKLEREFHRREEELQNKFDSEIKSKSTDIRILENKFPQLAITVRGNEIYVKGEPDLAKQFSGLVEELIAILRGGQNLTTDMVARSIEMIKQDPAQHPAEVLSLNILSNRGKTIRPKTANQKNYVDAIDTNTITFGIGPAGSGKTYLAMAKAVQALQAKQFNRIILTRPAVEAGERLGFLPGTLHEKIDPYLRPLFDALHDMIDQDAIPRLMNSGVIEVAPLAYMRGRTLNDAFIILDEAQNTTAEQMKMFLTRLGFGSKMVVTGDVTQVDLPNNSQSGLKIVQDILGDVADISFMHLTAEDVVRNRLVGDIVTAYGNWDENITKSTFPIRSGKNDR